jgi:hypothetical protein
MEGAMELSGYVRKYVASPLETSIQAREVSPIVRYYLIINVIKDLCARCSEKPWQPEQIPERRKVMHAQDNSQRTILFITSSS